MVVVLLAASGTLFAHALGYLFSHGPGRLGHQHDAVHGYVGTLTTTLAPLAAAALVVAARRIASRLAGPPTVGAVLVLQVGLFGAQEVLERLAQGELATLSHEPAVLVGLALQLPSALLVVGLVRLAGRVAGAAVAAGTPTAPPPLGPGSMLPSMAPVTVASDTPAHWVRRRGPPLLV